MKRAKDADIQTRKPWGFAGLGGLRVQHTIPNLPKGPHLATKWPKSGVFKGGFRGRGSKGPLFGSKRFIFQGLAPP